MKGYLACACACEARGQPERCLSACAVHVAYSDVRSNEFDADRDTGIGCNRDAGREIEIGIVDALLDENSTRNISPSNSRNAVGKISLDRTEYYGAIARERCCRAEEGHHSLFLVEREN